MIWKLFGFAILSCCVLSPAAGQGLVVSGQANDQAAVLNTADDWVILNSDSLIIEYGSDPREYGCVVTASADVKNPGPAFRENQYRFVLAHGDYFPNVDSPGERTLELVDNGLVATPGLPYQFTDIDDPDTESVMVTSFFRGLYASNGGNPPSMHTFWFLGRKGITLPEHVVPARTSMEVVNR